MKLITLENLKSFWKDVKSYVDNGLSKKADSVHGTHVSYGTINGKAPGTPSAGTSSKVAREDHVHPVQTTVSGNAGTATKLATARTINGTNFDGSANITTANWGTARTLTIGSTGKSVNGSANVSWSLDEIGARPRIKKVIDLSNTTTYPVDKWYPCLATIPYDGMHDIEVAVQLNSGVKPSWSTHQSGFTCNLHVKAIAGGWGTTTADSIVLNHSYGFASANPCSYSQLTNSNNAVLWLRGGGKYFVFTDWNASWSVKTASTEINSQTVAPATSCPSISLTKSTMIANLSGNATTATTLQTTRTINGTNFNGSANITTANWGTARNITIGNTAKSVNGSGNISWSLSEIGAASTAAATTSANGLMTSAMVSTLNTASSRASDWNTFKSSGGKINGNIAIPNGSAIAGPNGSAIGFTSGGETVVSSQGDRAGWLYFRPNGFRNTEGQAILKNDGVFELSNSLNVKDAEIGIQHPVEAVFKSFNHNKGLYINENNIGFYDWGKKHHLFCINEKDRAATIDVDNLFFGSYNLSNNGYTKLPNGLIIQWGTYHCHGGLDTGVYTIPFPITFPNGVFNCVTSVGGNNEPEANGITDSKIIAWHTSSFNIKLYKTDRNVGVNTYWFAIGY